MGQVCAGQGGVHFISEEIDGGGSPTRDPRAAAVLCGLKACVDVSGQPVEFASPASKPGAERPTAEAEPRLSRGRLLAPNKELRFGDYYEVGRELGEGSFGNVYEGRVLPVDSQTGRPVPAGSSQDDPSQCRRVAVKIFQIGDDSGQEASGRTRQYNIRKQQSFESERRMLSHLEHPNIVRMYECFQERSKLYIVLEICRGGELYGRLVQKVKQAGGGGGLDESLSRTLFRQMLHAVSYLHAKRIVHRDIKTENFLLVDEEGGHQAEVLKLCDFGTSCRLTDAHPRSMENIGTLSYTAPEIYEQRGADVAADCWSLGVVLYVILTGTNPFRLPGKACKEEVIKRIKNADFEIRRKSWIKISTPGQDVVRRLLVLDEQERLTCVQALRSRWALGSDRTTSKMPSSPVGGSASSQMAEHAPRVVSLLLRIPSLVPAQRLSLTACAMAATEGDLDPNVPWREFFVALDADQDGRLSFPEMVQGLRHMLGLASTKGGQVVALDEEDVTAERLSQCVQALDFDRSGLVDWVEWVALALLCSPGDTQGTEPVGTAYRLLSRPVRAADVTDIAPEDTATDAATDVATVADVVRTWQPPAVGQDGDAAEPRVEVDALSSSETFSLSHLRSALASLEVYKML